MDEMTPTALNDILEGKMPEASKEELRLAAKRIHDRKRYAEKTNLNWTQDAPSSDDRPRDLLQPYIQPDQAGD
jgi:hypothetical protein